MLDSGIYLFVILSFGLVIFQYKKEKRSLWMGIVFLLFCFSLAILAGLLLVKSPDTIYEWPVFMLILVTAVILLALPTILILTFILSGLKLMKREGKGLSHILSLRFGVAYIIYLAVWPMLENAFQNPIYSFIYAYLSFVFVFTLTIFALYTLTNVINLIKVPKKRYRSIIVLGSGLKDGKEVTPLLASRVDKGIEAYRENAGSKLILSGGRGADEKISEGQAMKNYACLQGVPEHDIIVENKSTTTNENLLFSKALIDEQDDVGNILVVTNRYHVLRALLLAKQLGIACDGRGAKTKLYFSINAFVREWIAYLVLWKRHYITVLAVAFVVMASGFLINFYYLM